MTKNRLLPILTFSRLHRRDLWGGIAVFVLNILLLFAVLGDMPLRLNQVSFAKDGDGVKSYYVTLWHIRHDISNHWFTGMNYPYGEHIFYTDGQPPLTNAMRWVSHHIADVSSHAVGTINSLMLFSIVAGAVLLYLVQRKAGVHLLVAAIAATALVWLSPQIGRLGGHYSLSYICSLPGVILFVMLYAEKPTWLRALLLAGWMLLLALTHLYFFVIAAVLLLVFWIYIFSLPGIPTGIRLIRVLHLIIQLAMPIALIQLYVHFTDPVTDRPGAPFGFMFYRAYPESVFLPLQTPYFPKLGNLLQMRHVQWEGYAYAGLAATLFFLGTIGVMIARAVRGNFRQLLRPFGDPFTGILFWAGTLALLYSWGVPFVLKMEGLLHYLGFLRQMRGIGRFAWLFFYGFNLAMIIVVWRWYAGKKNTLSAITLAALLAILSFDGWNNTRGLKKHIDNPLTLSAPAPGFLVDRSQYQAIVPLPYFHVGTENLWWNDDAGLLGTTMQISLHSGIPTTGNFLSRSSLSQAYSQIEPFLPLNSSPGIFNRYDHRKFLLLSSAEWTYDSIYRKLLDASTPVCSSDHYRLGEISRETYMEMLSGNNKTKTDTGGFIPAEPVLIKKLKKYQTLVYVPVPVNTCSVQVRMTVRGFAGDVVPRTGLQAYFRDENEKDLSDRWDLLGLWLAGMKGQDGYLLATYPIPAGTRHLGMALHNPDSKTKNLLIEDIGIKWIPCNP
ncbi:MAG TPA: hypothetical protein P5228_08775 [Bacteroidales bacterium]|nr:hypothetical protein [Bacteroidales bacterium]HRZ47954.1 hypothetical protein [Bacteroidales bacterium]